MWWAAAAFGWVIFAVWVALLGPSAVLMWFRTLATGVRSLSPPPAWPSLTVIVPARDEAAAVEAGLRSILASDYPALEVLAVDDRSTDATGAIMDRLAAGDARLRVMHIDSVPEGWLGKTHAMHRAAESAGGELLLFTDGDVLFSCDTIRRTVHYLLHKRLDHLCLMPTLIAGGYLERALLAYFAVLYAVGSQPWLVSTPFRFSYAGVGAFNLVRREAYHATGGFETLRLEVLDDVMFGKLIKWSGFRQDVLRSNGDVCVRWQPSAWGVVRGLEKNAFAAAGYSLVGVVAVTVAHLILLGVPYAALIAFRDARVLGFAAALVFTHAAYGLSGQAVAGDWRVFPMLPFGACGLMFAFWRSAALTLWRGGIRWRDTFYSLATLRKHRQSAAGLLDARQCSGVRSKAALTVRNGDDVA